MIPVSRESHRHLRQVRNIVIDENFVLKVSPKVDLAPTAPLLCAGITTYSPLRHHKIDKGMKVGVVGLGGLGHMGVKFANGFGAHGDQERILENELTISFTFIGILLRISPAQNND